MTDREDAPKQAIPATDAKPEPAGVSGEGAPKAGSPPAKRRYRRRLANLDNVRCGLADVIRELEEGERENGSARVLVYAYSALAGVINDARELGAIAERLAALEAGLVGRSGTPLASARPGFRSIIGGAGGAPSPTA